MRSTPCLVFVADRSSKRADGSGLENDLQRRKVGDAVMMM
jgi:hypothetical protein